MTSLQMFGVGILLLAFAVFMDNAYAATGYKYAKRYVGLHETVNNRQLRSILTVNPAKVAWCADFINSMEKKQGNRGTNSLMARSYLNYGKKISLTNAKEGDIIILKRGNSQVLGHVGYLVSQSKNYITILAGNQGDQVAYAVYPKFMVIGVRRK